MRRRKGLPKPSPSMYSGHLPEGYMGGLRGGSDLIKRGDYSIAESYLTRMAFKYSDGNFLFVLYLADVMFLQGKLEEAEKLYRDLIEANIAYAHSHHGLALVLIRTNREKEAEKHIKMATSLIGRAPDYLPSLE